MPHEPRLTIPGHLHEFTIRAFQGRSFFVPSKRSNALIVGAMGYAQEQAGLEVCFDTWMSNHAHLLVVPESEEQVGFLRDGDSEDQVSAFGLLRL